MNPIGLFMQLAIDRKGWASNPDFRHGIASSSAYASASAQSSFPFEELS